jgi:2-hydroxy-6-oxonona-2,4-dienedioate hydrolase
MTALDQFPLTLPDGSCTRILQAGADELPTILFLHGIGGRAERWCASLPAIAAAGLCCRAVDLPGHGFAGGAPLPRFDTAAMSAWLDAVYAGLGVDVAVLVGTSFGGFVALSYAWARPERVRAVVGVAPLGLRALGAERAARMSTSLLDATEDGVARRLHRLVHRRELITDQWLHRERRFATAAAAADAYQPLGAYLTSPDGIDAELVGPALASIASRTRVLLVWGSHDQAVPTEIGHHARTTANVDYVEIDDAGHLPYIEQSDAFNAAVLSYLTRLTADTATEHEPTPR